MRRLIQSTARKLCRATLVSEAGSLALKVLHCGGFYNYHGVVLLVSGLLQQPHFMESFIRKGRLKDLIRRIPIHAITTRAELAGAAAFGLQTLKQIRHTAKTQPSVATI